MPVQNTVVLRRPAPEPNGLLGERATFINLLRGESWLRAQKAPPKWSIDLRVLLKLWVRMKMSSERKKIGVTKQQSGQQHFTKYRGKKVVLVLFWGDFKFVSGRRDRFRIDRLALCSVVKMNIASEFKEIGFNHVCNSTCQICFQSFKSDYDGKQKKMNVTDVQFSQKIVIPLADFSQSTVIFFYYIFWLGIILRSCRSPARLPIWIL